MSTPLHPLADYVVAQNEKAESKTASGLYLPQNAQEKPKTVTVVAVGPAVQTVKIGDRIVFKSYSSTDVKVNKEDYVIVKEDEILAIVK